MLDTNAYTAYMRDDPSAVARVEASTRTGALLLTHDSHFDYVAGLAVASMVIP